MSRYAQIVRELTPPAVWHFGKRRLPGLVRALGGHYTHIRFSGDYASYADARREAEGYDAPAILEKTRAAVLKVKRKENRWERDAMVSDTDDMHWPLLACLMRLVALRGDRRLTVLDFGGSLGSTYFWCRPFFGDEIRVTWHVVEQPNHVKVGQADFQTDELRFHATVEDVLAREKPDVLLLSGVLHFMEDPEAFLQKLVGYKIPALIVDRTPLWDHDRHRLTIQHVPAEIYQASYPAWFLSRSRIQAIIEKDYELRFHAPDSEAWEIDDDVVPNTLWFYQRLSPPS
jgi:putative methyltransferase (TIGR04325 family)